MPQLHFSVDQQTARALAQKARARGLSLSRYVAELVQPARDEAWPHGYLKKVVGACRKTPLLEPSELPLDHVSM